MLYICQPKMVDVAQLVRALDCGSRGRRFKSGLPPKIKRRIEYGASFYFELLLN